MLRSDLVKAIDPFLRAYPESALGEMNARFESGDRRQIAGALWELFIWRTLREEEFEVSIHPTLSGTPKAVDFLASRDDLSVYIEAKAVCESDETEAEEGRIQAIVDAIDQHPHPSLLLRLSFDAAGKNELPRDVLNSWLDDLYIRSMRSAAQYSGDQTQQLVALADSWLEEAGWRIEATAHLRPDSAKKSDQDKMVFLRSGRARIPDDSRAIIKRFEDKAKRYGDLDKPFVIAMASARDFLDSEDFAKSVVGLRTGTAEIDASGKPTGKINLSNSREGGVFAQGNPFSQVSALLTTESLIDCWIKDTARPIRYWTNPEGNFALSHQASPWRSVATPAIT